MPQERKRLALSYGPEDTTSVYGEFISDPTLSKVRGVVEKDFIIEAVEVKSQLFRFIVSWTTGTKEKFLRVQDGLKDLGFYPMLRKASGRLVLGVLPSPTIKPSRLWKNILLLAATIATTSFAGYQLSAGITDQLVGALSFSAALMAILGGHELGHKFFANLRKIPATFPYFIPIPPIPGFLMLGTIGAFIRMKTAAPNRDSLFDMAVAGPLAGFTILIPVALIGGQLSMVLPLNLNSPGFNLPVPLLFSWLIQIVKPSIEPGMTVVLHPVAFAAWVGMLITFLNLMPSGQLDGGHIARTVFGQTWHRPVSFAAAGVAWALGFTIFAMLMFLFALTPHRGSLDDVSPLSKNRKLVTIGLYGIMVITAVQFGPLFGGRLGA